MYRNCISALKTSDISDSIRLDERYQILVFSQKKMEDLQMYFARVLKRRYLCE